MRNLARSLVAVLLCFSLSGCLGSTLRTPAPKGEEVGSRLSVTLLWGLKPTMVDANECKKGVAATVQVWPIWGVVVSLLTFFLVVPTYTAYDCTA